MTAIGYRASGLRFHYHMPPTGEPALFVAQVRKAAERSCALGPSFTATVNAFVIEDDIGE